jgi:hypothetical protein
MKLSLLTRFASGLGASLLVLGIMPSGAAADPSVPSRKLTVDFARDIKPILSEHCLECHGPEKARGGFRLTNRVAALGASASGASAIVPGKPEASELVRRITTTDRDERMPPRKKEPLRPAEIEKLRQWIAEGVAWTEHWAWQPLQKATLPEVRAGSWVRTGVDRFVLARLEEKGITPSSEADRYTLIKRLSYDLLGLPPSPEEADAYANDRSRDAYEKLVERLLASPHFGERWGRHWLDLAHFADSDGYETDRARPDAYLYRDWVIRAFNDDLPFDQFTIEQLAGDLLPEPTAQQKIATAFNRQTLTNEEGGVDQEEFRVAAAFDRTETVGTVWLGLTVGCVRCHSHKYDPIAHAEYYKLFAFFNNADEITTRLPVQADRLGELETKLRPLGQALATRYAELAPQARQWEDEQHRFLIVRSKESSAHKPSRPLPKDIADALEMYPEKRVAGTRRRLFDYYVTEVAKDEQLRSLQERMAALQKEHKARMAPVRTLASTLQPRQTCRFDRGDFLSPREPVQPGTPAILAPFRPRANPHNRLDLAHWLLAPENALTPRVAVNHVWKHLFGEGLVRTMNDFGTRGERPTNPELLDWLASRFRGDLKWSRKALIRLLVDSAVYRQSSRHWLELDESDPENALYHRQNRFRVESEIVRDLHLAASGLLTRRLGGPSVFPPMAEDLAALSYANNFTWKNSTGPDRYRRGLYTFFKRTIPHPDLMTFDSPDANIPCVARTVSNTPLQSLLLLNNETHVEAAQALARRLLRLGSVGDAERLAYAMRLCVARPPRSPELSALQSVLEEARKYYAAHAAEAEQFAGPHAAENAGPAEAAAWVAVARVVFNLDEFITRE